MFDCCFICDTCCLDAVVQRVVVVASYVVNCLVWIGNCVTIRLCLTLEHCKNLGYIASICCRTCDPTFCCVGIHTALDQRVTTLVVELTKTMVVSLGIVLRGKVCSCCCTHLPRFTVNNDVRIDFVEGFNKLVHCVKVMQSHQVETETSKIVFLCPEACGVNHKLAEHVVFACCVVTTTGTIGGCSISVVTVVVTWHQNVEVVANVTACVVVNNVHDDTDTSILVRLNKLLELANTNVTVVAVCAVCAFDNVVVKWVVTPVECNVAFVVILVENWDELNCIYAQLFDVVETCCNSYTTL